MILGLFEYLTILSHLNCLCILEFIVSYSFWYMENRLISKPSMIYICKVKVHDLFATYCFKTMKLLSYSWKPNKYKTIRRPSNLKITKLLFLLITQHQNSQNLLFFTIWNWRWKRGGGGRGWVDNSISNQNPNKFY